MSRDRILGLTLLLIGLLFGLRQLDLIPERVEELLFRWEMILIGLGFYFMAVERKGSAGLVLFLIGLLFWIPKAFEIPHSIGLWPLMLILLGGVLLFRRGRKRKQTSSASRSTRDGAFRESVLFGSNERIVTDEAFQGGELTVLFGDSKVDLTRCKWSEEGEREIEVFVLFGGSTLHVPQEWNIEIEVSSIFGSFRDLRSQKLMADADKKERVLIKGLCLFGEGKLRD